MQDNCWTACTGQRRVLLEYDSAKNHWDLRGMLVGPSLLAIDAVSVEVSDSVSTLLLGVQAACRDLSPDGLPARTSSSARLPGIDAVLVGAAGSRVPVAEEPVFLLEDSEISVSGLYPGVEEPALVLDCVAPFVPGLLRVGLAHGCAADFD